MKWARNAVALDNTVQEWVSGPEKGKEENPKMSDHACAILPEPFPKPFPFVVYF